MIGQMTGHMRPAPKNSPGNVWEHMTDSNRRREEIIKTIDGLYVTSRRGLWRLLLFLVISTVALYFKNFDLFAVLPGNVQEMLGAPPPPDMIHIVLAVSTISALILIAGRTTGDAKAGPGWLQFGMSAAFYPLYAVSNVLNQAFPVIFAAGLLILVLEYAAIWAQASRAILEEKERLGRLSLP